MRIERIQELKEFQKIVNYDLVKNILKLLSFQLISISFVIYLASSLFFSQEFAISVIQVSGSIFILIFLVYFLFNLASEALRKEVLIRTISNEKSKDIELIKKIETNFLSYKMESFMFSVTLLFISIYFDIKFTFLLLGLLLFP